MANPEKKNLPADTWVRVAQNVTTGFVFVKKYGPKYITTYRMTGNSAPSHIKTAVPVSDSFNIESDDPIDVYVMAQNKAGEVIVCV